MNISSSCGKYLCFIECKVIPHEWFVGEIELKWFSFYFSLIFLLNFYEFMNRLMLNICNYTIYSTLNSNKITQTDFIVYYLLLNALIDSNLI